MIRTRFAPSPTGYLHIGGVRTALFNWLLARSQDGVFILRIDDTDRQRNVEQALRPILEGFRWLGLDWDEGPEVGGDYGPYFQSQRDDHYQTAIETLLRRGHAYRDYATQGELQEERQAAQSNGEKFIYSRRWMAETKDQEEAFAAEGRQGVVRLKMPRQGSCIFDDLIRGEMDFAWEGEQDHVIQRADNSVLYHLASAVDDIQMEISHVVRAEEHLSNTPRHIFITRGLGQEPPQYAHLPYVAEPGSKNKLSKRKLEKYLKNPEFARLNEHGKQVAEAIGLEISAEAFNPVIVDFYETVGYLPDAILNYLLLLGWSFDDKREQFSRQEMIEHFSLARVNRAPASFDPLKLSAFQERHMQALPLEAKCKMMLPYLRRASLLPSPIVEDSESYVKRIVEAAGDRLKVAGDILDYEEFFLDADAIAYDEKAFEKRLRKPDDAALLLAEYRQCLAAIEIFEVEELEASLVAFVEGKGIKLGRIIHALRVAVSGKAVGFGMFDILGLLGRRQCLARIDQVLARLA